MKQLAIVLSGIIILACTDTPTAPDNPPEDPRCQWDSALSPGDGACRPPRVDAAYSLEARQGIIAFGLGHPLQNEEDVLAFVAAAMGAGRNTFQICSEAEWWDEGSRELPRKPRDLERLDWTLDILARVPGVQVELIGICTLKRQVPLAEQYAWAEEVAGLASKYANVAIFTHNEFDNCAGRADWGGDRRFCAGKEEVKRHIAMYKRAGFGVVTADDSFTKDPARTRGMPQSQIHGFRLANAGAWPASFHPDRERKGVPWDPSLEDLQLLARYNGKFILSETVAWADWSGRCDGLRTCDQARIEAYRDSCAAVPECSWTFHCEACLAGEVPLWIPTAR